MKPALAHLQLNCLTFGGVDSWKEMVFFSFFPEPLMVQKSQTTTWVDKTQQMMGYLPYQLVLWDF